MAASLSPRSVTKPDPDNEVVLPLSRYTRVKPTEAYFKMYPKSKVKIGVIVGFARNSIGYRVKWDGHSNPKTVSPRLIQAVPYTFDPDRSAKHGS